MFREEKFMSSTKPVVVYGASGYTGRLVCEYLREFNVPFIAAGRDKARIQEALDLIPGINTVDHEVVEVDHEIGPLSDLFARGKVVCNTVGPFARLGRQVVEACIRAGSHYVDTTGEIAANLCLETPGLDTLDILVFWKGAPTIASTQTILVNAAMSKAYYLEQNEYIEWPNDGGLYDVTVPGQHQTALALPWGGTSHPVWFRHDPRVANVKALGGLFDRQLMQGVPLIVRSALERVQGLPDDEKYTALSAVASSVQNQMPPRENPRINTSLDSVHASGPLGRAHCVIHGNCNYKQTALLHAFAAYSLLQQPPRRPGFASACQAFGHRELLGVLRSFGLLMEPILTDRKSTRLNSSHVSISYAVFCLKKK